MGFFAKGHRIDWAKILGLGLNLLAAATAGHLRANPRLALAYCAITMTVRMTYIN
jgi:hypothetical protein